MKALETGVKPRTFNAAVRDEVMQAISIWDNDITISPDEVWSCYFCLPPKQHRSSVKELAMEKCFNKSAT